MFGKISDFLFKILQLFFVLLFIAILCFIVKWRIDALYINSLSENKINFSLVDEFQKTKKDILTLKNGEIEDQVTTPQQLLDEDSNKNSNILTITIPENSSIDDIGNILIENNLMTSLSSFKSLVDSMGLNSKFVAGSFEIKKDSKIRDTILTLTNTESKEYEFEILEGAAADAVGKKLQSLGVIQSASTFSQNAKDYNVFYKFKPGKYKIQTPIKVKNLIEILTGEKIQ